MNTKQTVYIVDDDSDVADSMSMLLESTGLRTEQYHSAEEFLKTPIDLLVGCLILDVRMPDMSGLDLHQEIKRNNANLPVVFVTGHGDVPMAVQAMKNGALEFLQKPFRDQEFIDCVNRALKTNSEALDELNRRRSIQARIDSLTKREYEIMRLIAAGNITKVVASKLSISPRTVEIHRARTMEKMQAKTLAQLVQMVVEVEHQEAVG
ncbi:response regulator [SAR92 clade bacterium H455]|uniref:Response regulator n=1 Tax=SAR92 clade bacterium H455 TaxID=2974818 RepID=A0ABY5TV58_9GAMM|nr:response regulator [SAR92 clade bacterium H455]